MSLIETHRLRLRRFEISDLSRIRELESDPAVMKFTPMRQALTIEKSEERLKSQIERQKSLEPLGIWAVETKDRADFIGWVMLAPTGHEFPEIGFMIVQRHWGQGYASEVVRALIDASLNQWNLSGLMATTDMDNQASKKVLMNHGFSKSKTVSKWDPVLNHQIELEVFELKHSK